MAIRKTTHILKNTQTNNKSLPTTGVEMGEPLVNLFNGILYFSGTSGGNFTPSDNNSTYFEVGSNINNLVIRNQITSYSGLTNLSGKFLSGTTNGFVLADISDLDLSDTFVTGFTYTPNTNVLTISRNQGELNLPVTLSAFTNLYLYSTTTVDGDLNVNGTQIVNNLTITGTGLYNTTTLGSNPLEIVNFNSLTGYLETNDTYVTGGTVSTPANNNNKSVTIDLNYKNDDGNNYTLTTENTFVTGGTYDTTGTITFHYNDNSKPSFIVTGIDGTDTYVTGGTITTTPSSDSINGVIGLKYSRDVIDNLYTLPFSDVFLTGFTYDSNSNKLTLVDNSGNTLTQYINQFSGITISNLTPSQVVYVGSGGQLKTDTTGEFVYNDSTNTLTLGTTSGNLVVNNSLSDGPVRLGQGGLVVGSNGSVTTPGIGDLIVHGNFIVFGTGTTVATNELYVEDPQITLNYNPTGDTSITSVSSGIRIQNGAGLLSGVTSGDTYFTIAQLNTLTGLTPTQIPDVTEYTGSDGYNNRGWLTQLNDIVIRNTNFNNGAPNGVRVLAEGDFLDGGQW